MSGRVIHVETSEDFHSKISNSKTFGGKGVVVDFTAEWCGPCKAIAPVLEDLSRQFPGIAFLKVDVDKLQDIARSCGVSAMPTFHSYFNGNKVEELTGANPAKLRDIVERLSTMSCGDTGGGRTIGGSTGTNSEVPMRELMAAAAEARLKALEGQPVQFGDSKTQLSQVSPGGVNQRLLARLASLHGTIEPLHHWMHTTEQHSKASVNNSQD